MKKIMVLLVLPLCLSVKAQVSYDFETGMATGWLFNQPERWSVSDDSPLDGLYSLHHSYDNSVASADAALFSIRGLCPECGTTVWKFTIRHGTEPSSSNRWSFLLMSDAGPDEVTGNTGFNGFVTGVNLTGYDDTLRLWHLNGGKATVVITAGINWQEDIGSEGMAAVTVTHQTDGTWILEAVWSTAGQADDEGGGEESGQGSWSGAEVTTHTARYAGIVYNYTSSRDRLLWIDNVSVEGVFIADTVPPEVVSVVALKPDKLQVIFNEETDASYADTDNLTLGSGRTIIRVDADASDRWSLEPDGAVINRATDRLVINRLCDMNGNCVSDLSFSFMPAYAETGDIVISEIMADPTPSRGLPEREYLEITNRTDDSLFTGEMYLIADDDTTYLDPEWIRAGEYIILCSAAGGQEFLPYGRVMALTPFPAINDNGEVIALRGSNTSLIHAVSYTPGFLGDGVRSGGGWSAELTDMTNPFNEPEAWNPSVDDSGGTPGRVNSAEIITIDSKCPRVIAAWPLSPDTVAVMFDETVMISDSEPWSADDGDTYPAISGGPADRLLLVRLYTEIAEGDILHLLPSGSVTDFAGNAPCTTEIATGLANDPVAGDVTFNELLFDPADGCSEYLELYNCSGKIIDLSRLFLANGSSSAEISFTDIPYMLLPENYAALTTDRDEVTDTYPCSDPEAVFEADRLPSMADDEGTMILYDYGLNIIDRVDYSASMHLSFLSGYEGIALEKVSPGLASDVAGNWHSASERCRWGTPGAPNSVMVDVTDAASGLTLSSSRVSPDGDGFEDVISVSVFPGEEDNIVSVMIFSDRGYRVRTLAERFAAGQGACFIWDGTTDNGDRLPAGLYMIMAESYNTAGVSRRWKKICAVLYR